MARLRRIGLWLLFLSLVVVAAGQRFGDATLDPKEGDATVDIQLVDYGLHAALFISTAALKREAERLGTRKLVVLLRQFAYYDTLEFGWGDESFYREVPRWSDATLTLALSALIGLNSKTVLLVVGHDEPVDAHYPGLARATITLSERAFSRIVPEIEATLAGVDVPEPLGPGLYGPSLFYRATGRYSLFNVCNHWDAHLLEAAGRPVNLTLATWSRALILQMN